MKKYSYFSSYLESLQKQGKYLFSKTEVARILGVSNNALRNSVARLSYKGKIAHLKKGLYQIIPIEYESAGSLPPEWIIDELMKYLGIPYYIGLLSAASLHGAAHQAPQIFQVIAQKKIPDLKLGGIKICFYESKDFSVIPIQTIKTPAGYVNVSTPEGTSFDLIRYLHQSGHLNHVATILSELAEEIDGEKLVLIAQNLSFRYTQRLGYLLDILGFESLTQPLAQFIEKRRLPYISLRPDKPKDKAQRNTKWRLFINEQIDPDI